MLAKNRIRHTIVSILLVHSLLAVPTITHALSCASRHFTLSEAYGAADSIIVGLITECKEEISRDSWANGGDDCSFTSLEVLKESVPARDYSGVTSSSGCGLSLHVGGQYLLFLDSKNQPMHFSAPLSGDRYQVQFANRYLRIIRDFRNGVVNDLAEPWTYGEYEGQCSINHRIRGHQISFSRGSPGGPQHPIPDWTQESINGETVYKATVSMIDLDSKMPSGEAELVAFGNVPDFANDKLVFKVSLQERSPAPARQATLSVGDRTWSLNRMEMNLTLAGASTHKAVEYYAAGDVAERILSAMVQPSDIVVTATVVASNSAPTDAEVPPPDQPSFGVAPSKDDFLVQAAPGLSSTRPSAAPNVRAADSNRSQSKPPEPVLRVESRSTQLTSVIQSFRACYAGGEQ
jgi:hypothetical protein